MPQPNTYRSQPLTGAVFVLSASLVFAILGAVIKIVSASLSNEMIVFFRNACALIFILPWVWIRHPPGGIRTRCFQLHLVRSIAGLAAMYCFFYTIAKLQLSEAFLLVSTAPLFIPMIAYAWMREPVANNVRGAILIGFVGIVMILKPGFGMFQPVAFVGLGSGVFAAVAMVSIRRMSASEPAIRIVFYFAVLSSVMSAGPLFWSWQSPQPEIWWMLVLIGLLATVGQFLLTKGYGFAPAAQVGPFVYANIVFATFVGWIFWGETLDLQTWLGAFLICIAGIVTTRRTKVHAIAGPTARPVP
ncbi:MAG: DMT family transporter [Pseudomonadota bacterium]|uniref:DMT family transporter n=1 Tax=Candidatus Desulfatibia profunda TaxID=2841695 RepID=A0A8J6NNN9_9BACT|nr:DMT family transporter [Candidatus Desulfatibia profunda]MBL7181250.1 DMT family transporter [Desulfobacterales bacterium]